MKIHAPFRFLHAAFLAGLTIAAAACVGATDDPSSASAALATPAGEVDAADDPELPPLDSAAAIDRWIAKGYYRSWACEASAHDSRPPSGHSPNRICSNAKLASHGAGEYPRGAATVKELYDDAGTSIVGYAVATKVGPGAGESWHWYERLGTRIVANGLGNAGPARTICTRCHLRAGPATFGHDLIFTQVRP